MSVDVWIFGAVAFVGLSLVELAIGTSLSLKQISFWFYNKLVEHKTIS